MTQSNYLHAAYMYNNRYWVAYQSFSGVLWHVKLSDKHCGRFPGLRPFHKQPKNYTGTLLVAWPIQQYLCDAPITTAPADWKQRMCTNDFLPLHTSPESLLKLLDNIGHHTPDTIFSELNEIFTCPLGEKPSWMKNTSYKQEFSEAWDSQNLKEYTTFVRDWVSNYVESRFYVKGQPEVILTNCKSPLVTFDVVKYTLLTKIDKVKYFVFVTKLKFGRPSIQDIVYSLPCVVTMEEHDESIKETEKLYKDNGLLGGTVPAGIYACKPFEYQDQLPSFAYLDTKLQRVLKGQGTSYIFIAEYLTDMFPCKPAGTAAVQPVKDDMFDVWYMEPFAKVMSADDIKTQAFARESVAKLTFEQLTRLRTWISQNEDKVFMYSSPGGLCDFVSRRGRAGEDAAFCGKFGKALSFDEMQEIHRKVQTLITNYKGVGGSTMTLVFATRTDTQVNLQAWCLGDSPLVVYDKNFKFLAGFVSTKQSEIPDTNDDINELTKHGVKLVYQHDTSVVNGDRKLAVSRAIGDTSILSAADSHTIEVIDLPSLEVGCKFIIRSDGFEDNNNDKNAVVAHCEWGDTSLIKTIFNNRTSEESILQKQGFDDQTALKVDTDKLEPNKTHVFAIFDGHSGYYTSLWAVHEIPRALGAHTTEKAMPNMNNEFRGTTDSTAQTMQPSLSGGLESNFTLPIRSLCLSFDGSALCVLLGAEQASEQQVELYSFHAFDVGRLLCRFVADNAYAVACNAVAYKERRKNYFVLVLAKPKPNDEDTIYTATLYLIYPNKSGDESQHDVGFVNHTVLSVMFDVAELGQSETKTEELMTKKPATYTSKAKPPPVISASFIANDPRYALVTFKGGRTARLDLFAEKTAGSDKTTSGCPGIICLFDDRYDKFAVPTPTGIATIRDKCLDKWCTQKSHVFLSYSFSDKQVEWRNKTCSALSAFLESRDVAHNLSQLFLDDAREENPKKQLALFKNLFGLVLKQPEEPWVQTLVTLLLETVVASYGPYVKPDVLALVKGHVRTPLEDLTINLGTTSLNFCDTKFCAAFGSKNNNNNIGTVLFMGAYDTPPTMQSFTTTLQDDTSTATNRSMNVRALLPQESSTQQTFLPLSYVKHKIKDIKDMCAVNNFVFFLINTQNEASAGRRAPCVLFSNVDTFRIGTNTDDADAGVTNAGVTNAGVTNAGVTNADETTKAEAANAEATNAMTVVCETDVLANLTNTYSCIAVTDDARFLLLGVAHEIHVFALMWSGDPYVAREPFTIINRPSKTSLKRDALRLGSIQSITTCANNSLIIKTYHAPYGNLVGHKMGFYASTKDEPAKPLNKRAFGLIYDMWNVAADDIWNSAKYGSVKDVVSIDFVNREITEVNVDEGSLLSLSPSSASLFVAKPSLESTQVYTLRDSKQSGDTKNTFEFVLGQTKFSFTCEVELANDGEAVLDAGNPSRQRTITRRKIGSRKWTLTVKPYLPNDENLQLQNIQPQALTKERTLFVSTQYALNRQRVQGNDVETKVESEEQVETKGGDDMKGDAKGDESNEGINGDRTDENSLRESRIAAAKARLHDDDGLTVKRTNRPPRRTKHSFKEVLPRDETPTLQPLAGGYRLFSAPWLFGINTKRARIEDAENMHVTSMRMKRRAEPNDHKTKRTRY